MTNITLNIYLEELERREFLIEMKSGRAYYSEMNNLNKIKRVQWQIREFLNA